MFVVAETNKQQNHKRHVPVRRRDHVPVKSETTRGGIIRADSIEIGQLD
jgi:hypothetical protein